MVFTKAPGGRNKAVIEKMIANIEKMEVYKFSEFRNYDNKIQIILYYHISNGVKKPCIMYWINHSSKFKSYGHKSEAHREIHLLSKVEDIKSKIETKKQFDIEAKEAKKTIFENCKIGDIFYRSFGYSMTFVDFYQVVGKKGKTKILIRPINDSTDISDGGYSGFKKPVKDSFISDQVICTTVHFSGITHNGNMYYKTSEESTHYFNTMD